MTEARFTAKEIAVLAGTTAKRMRSFIRAQDEKGTPIVDPVGSGARYSFTAAEAHALVQGFRVRRISAGSPVTRDAETLRMLLADALADAETDAETDADDDA